MNAVNPVCFSCVLPDTAALKTLVPAVQQGGFEGIEPTFTLSGGFPSAENLAESARALRRAADDCGLKIPSMRAGPAFWDRFVSPRAELRAETAALAEKMFEALRIMGGNTLLAVPGRWTAEQGYRQAWDHGVESARKIGDLAGRAGIILALENVENEFLCSPRDWNDFLGEIGHPSVGMYFDVGNLVRNRQGPPAQWLAALGARWVKRIHFKGACVGGPLTGLLDGEVPWPGVMAVMRQLNYQDWVGIELIPPPYCRQEWLKMVYLSTREILNLEV